MIGYSSLAASHVGASPLARRESIHLGIALAALSLPWLFSSAWPVFVLVGAALAGLALLRASRWHGSDVRAALREMRGEFWFACGLGLVFLWSATEPVAYCIAILLFALADTAAALVGRRYGRAQRMLGGARKSAAGSLAFFATALAVVGCGLYAGAGLRPGEALAAALWVATLTTALEAALADGLDNLFVPLGALAALELTAL